MAKDRCALVYKGLPPDCTCCDQALRILPSGDWVVVFMTGGATEPELANHIVLCRSTDRGLTWSDPEVVLRYEDRACLLSEVVVHGAEMTVFVFTHRGFFEDWRVWTIASTDGGRAWSDPTVFEPLSRRTFVRTLTVSSWGEWLLPYQTYDTVPDPSVSPLRDGSHKQAYNGVLISGDWGASWEASNRVGPTAGWAENNVVERGDGTLVMLIRADGTGHLVRSESADRGRTWTQPVATGIPNPGSKFLLRRLADGRIVLVHNPNPVTRHPNSKRQANCARNPLALWVSDSDMETWGCRRVLTDFPGMLAYPDGVVDEEEGYVHFAFDYNRHDVIYWGAALP